MTKIKKFRILIIVLLVGFVAIASLGYKKYQHTPDYIIPDEFLEQYNNENTKEDDSNTADDSSFSSSLSLIFDNPIGQSYIDHLEEKINSIDGSEELEADSDSKIEYSFEIIEVTTYYCVAENYLNIRDFPDTDGKILGTVARSEEIEVYGFATNDAGEIWAEISYNDKIGFVSRDYISKDPVSKYSQSDIYLFAQILYAEAGGCDNAEMARVGQVVLNRINTDYSEFKCCTSIYSTLYHTGAYPDTVTKIENGLVPSKEALQVAEGLLEGTIQSGLGTNVLWQTGFYPNWNATVVYVSEWGHYYSKLAQ